MRASSWIAFTGSKRKLKKMGEWKVQVSIRVPAALREELEALAKREHRTLGNLGMILLEWASEQLRAARSTVDLLNREEPVPRNPDGNYRRRVKQ
jgi:hypothetical protein